MERTSDDALIEQIASGDKLAMRTLFARHQLRVFRFLCSILRDQAAAEDLLNEVFIDVWRQAGKIRGPLERLDLDFGDRPLQGFVGAQAPASRRIRRGGCRRDRRSRR